MGLFYSVCLRRNGQYGIISSPTCINARITGISAKNLATFEGILSSCIIIHRLLIFWHE